MMFDENEPLKKFQADIFLGQDLSTFSLEDIDERVSLLESEISRLKEERVRKSNSLNAAESFFKK